MLLMVFVSVLSWLALCLILLKLAVELFTATDTTVGLMWCFTGRGWAFILCDPDCMQFMVVGLELSYIHARKMRQILSSVLVLYLTEK